MAIVYIGLGSNKGDRVGFIQQATSLLGGVQEFKIIRTSSFYETQPWLEKETTWFVNAIIEAKTSLSPKELLKECQRIELQLGRNRSIEGHFGDRNIDLDILFYGNEIIEEENLRIPHKFFHKRAFTLVPMLELNPSFIHPELNISIEELYDELENPEMVFLYGTRIDDI